MVQWLRLHVPSAGAQVRELDCTCAAKTWHNQRKKETRITPHADNRAQIQITVPGGVQWHSSHGARPCSVPHCESDGRSAVSNSAIPRTVAHQVSLSLGFPRQEYWSELPFPSPGNLPDPGIEPGVLLCQTHSLPSELPVEPVPQCTSRNWKCLGSRKTRAQFLSLVAPDDSRQILLKAWSSSTFSHQMRPTSE